MAVVRPTQVETIYINSYYIYDSKTNQETKRTSHPIQVTSTYSNPAGGGGNTISWKYLRFDLNDIASQSQYYNEYVIKNVNNFFLYRSDYYPKTKYFIHTHPEYPELGYYEIVRYAELNFYLSKNNSLSTNDDSISDFYESYFTGNLNLTFENYDNSKNFFSTYMGAKLSDYFYKTGGGYRGDAIITITGPGQGSNSPQTQLFWQRCDPDITSVAPASGSFIDDTNISHISWNIDAPVSASGKTYYPLEIQFQWGTTQSLGNNIDLVLNPEDLSTYKGLDIPANTFPSKATIYWKIRWKNPFDNSYVETSIGTYTTVDSTPTVKPTYPVNASIDGAVDNTFTWDYQIDTASKQKAFDLQYSANNGLSWENVFTKEPSNNTFAVIPANTFNAGNNLWKVRAYNTDDVASEWSTPASIVVRAAPIKPTISSVTKKPKITVGWQSTGQQAFQVIANDIDSGVVFGTGKTYTIPYYFRDGETVNIKVRIKNRFSEWSECSEISVTVENTSTGNITALAQNVGNDVKLTWATETEFVCFYVLRGGIPIAKTTDLKEYTDYTSVGANEYQIMGITADGYYTLSNVVPVSVLPQTAVIGILSNVVSWITLTYRRGNLPEIITSSSEEVYYQYYSGRKLPVAYSSRFKTKKKTLNFTVYKQDADAIENMIGQTVIYKDYADNKIIGIVNDVETSSYANRPDVRMEITAIDYLEDVGYD